MTKKSKKGTKENPIHIALAGEITSTEEKQIRIISAIIKDDFCNYSYDITLGVGIGDTHNVKGKGIIKDDMRDAFGDFNVHLATVDDIFKHSGIDIKNIDKLRNHPHVGLYEVTGFKIKGIAENETICLIGTKYVNIGGHIELETPPIALDNLSSYPWWNELKSAADVARKEVELYKNGKYTSAEPEETEDAEQLTIGDELNNAELEKARVN